MNLIYLDYAATTPLDPRVREAMSPWLGSDDGYANPASDHLAGRAARAAVEAARAQVAAAIGAQPDEIVWTSGATEADNLAIKGAVEFHATPGRPAHVVTSRVEHRAVLDTCRYLETRGVRMTYLEPEADGTVSVERVLAALRAETLLVSLMWVNNETGAVTDVPALAPALRSRGVLFHVDAAQAAGRVPINLREVPVDLLTLSAHKAYGPKGIGALFVRRRPRARLAPQQHGGGHEWGMRSGTLPTHQIVGMGAAFAQLGESLAERPRLVSLREILWQRLAVLPGVLRNGDPERSSPHVLNVSFPGVEGESLRAALPGLAVSSGSACSSATREPSYVLRALGRDDRLADASLRFSFGRFTAAEHIEAAARQVVAQVRRLRALSPRDAGGEPAPREAADAAAEVPATALGYSEPVWRLFWDTPNAGRLGPAARVVVGEARSPAADAELRLELRLVGSRIEAARFMAHGCPTTIAVGAWLAQRLHGKPLPRGGIDAETIRRALEIPEPRAHCALLGEDVVRDALSKIAEVIES